VSPTIAGRDGPDCVGLCISHYEIFAFVSPERETALAIVL